MSWISKIAYKYRSDPKVLKTEWSEQSGCSLSTMEKRITIQFQTWSIERYVWKRYVKLRPFRRLQYVMLEWHDSVSERERLCKIASEKYEKRLNK